LFYASDDTFGDDTLCVMTVPDDNFVENIQQSSNYAVGIFIPLRGCIPKGQILSGPIPMGCIRYADLSTMWMYPEGI
jgi:hypothetical protein